MFDNGKNKELRSTIESLTSYSGLVVNNSLTSSNDNQQTWSPSLLQKKKESLQSNGFAFDEDMRILRVSRNNILVDEEFVRAGLTSDEDILKRYGDYAGVGYCSSTEGARLETTQSNDGTSFPASRGHFPASGRLDEELSVEDDEDGDGGSRA